MGIPCGLAVIGGAVSGDIEILDFDAVDRVAPWAATVEERAPGLLDRLILVQTPRPGLHVYYRSRGVARNQVLAQRSVLEDGEVKDKTTIETRAEGGYAVIPPSPYYCHPSGRPYVFLGKDLTHVTTITDVERNILVQAAIELDQRPPPEPPQRRRQPQRRPSALGSVSPGDDFNARADWVDLLTTREWTFVRADGEVEYWRRPGRADGGYSATVNFGEADLLHIFSSNAAPLEAEKSYTKFAFVTMCDYDGDYSAAARALREQGYGIQLPRRRRGRSRGTPSHQWYV
jgi:putative DNA primase/helicase